MKNIAPIILLMLICGSANAAMYSCVDENGTKILRSYPCEKNEKQQAIEKEVTPSHTIINSTGERQDYRSREPVIASTAVSTTPKTIYDCAVAALGGDRDHTRVLSMVRALATSTPPPKTIYDCETIYDRAVAALGGDRDHTRVLSMALALAAPQAESDIVRQARALVTVPRSDPSYGIRLSSAIHLLSGSAPMPPIIPNPAFPIPEAPPTFSIPEPPPMMPSRITNCDLAGCRDDLGNRYNHIGGDMYSTPSGNCQVVGNFMRCP